MPMCRWGPFLIIISCFQPLDRSVLQWLRRCEGFGASDVGFRVEFRAQGFRALGFFREKELYRAFKGTRALGV